MQVNYNKINASPKLAIAVMFFLLVAIALIGFYQFHRLREARASYRHTVSALNTLHAVLEAAQDAETGQRGFLLTGQDDYLAVHETGVSQMKELLPKLKTLIGDSPEQAKKINELETTINSKFVELTQTIELRRTKGPAAATAMVRNNTGKQNMNKIRAIIAQIKEKEESLLTVHSAEMDKRSQAVFFGIFSICAVALIFQTIMGLIAINGKKLAENNLRENLLRLKEQAELLELSSDAILLRDFDGTIQYWNNGADVIYRYTKQQALGRKSHDLFKTEFPKPLPEIEEEILTKGVWVGELIHYRPDNKKIIVYSRHILKRDINGKGTGVLEINTDITERKKMEQRIQEDMVTLKEQADLLELSSDAIMLRDFDGTIRYWNHGADVIYGYTKQQALGTKSHVLLKTEFPKPLPEIEEEILTNGSWVGELIHYKPDNQRINVYSRHILKRDIEGKGTGILEINTDITERKEIERHVSEFYSMVSHELRTPLTSIRGTLSLMEDGRLGPLAPRAQHLTQIALSESERLVRLINDILDIRKIESGNLPLAFEELLPSEIVDSTSQSLAGLAQQSSIKLKSQIETTDKIDCDRDRISQVLTNLISNAIKFSPQGAEILVYVKSTNPQTIRFSVIDKGSGIPPDQLSKLFVPFQQLDSSDSRPKGGTGLGLAISKAIVEQHGGKIGVSSAIGGGSTFWFELPVKQNKMTIMGDNVPGRYKVLLVEDDHHLCVVLAEALASQGYRVDEAPTLMQATEYLATQDIPDVILLDIELPDGSGLELLQQIRKQARINSIPVVIITGSEQNSSEYAHPLLIDWIKKPFDIQRLLSAFKLAIHGDRVPGQARVLVVDDDAPTRELIKQQLQSFDLEYLEAGDGIDAVHQARNKDPDLIILDLAMPQPDGFKVVEILRQEKNHATPLLIYTARDLGSDDKEKLKLGISAFLTKSRTSEEQFLSTVKNLLNGLLTEQAKENQTVSSSATLPSSSGTSD